MPQCVRKGFAFHRDARTECIISSRLIMVFWKCPNKPLMWLRLTSSPPSSTLHFCSHVIIKAHFFPVTECILPVVTALPVNSHQYIVINHGRKNSRRAHVGKVNCRVQLGRSKNNRSFIYLFLTCNCNYYNMIRIFMPGHKIEWDFTDIAKRTIVFLNIDIRGSKSVLQTTFAFSYSSAN